MRMSDCQILILAATYYPPDLLLNSRSVLDAKQFICNVRE